MRDAIWVRWMKWIVGADRVPAKVRVPVRPQRMRMEHLDDRRLPSMNPMWFGLAMGGPTMLRAEFTTTLSTNEADRDTQATNGALMCPFHHHPLLFGGWFGGSPWDSQESTTDVTHFDVQLLSEAYNGETVRIAVVALDESNQPVRDYEGTIHFTSSDPSLELPDDYTFTASDRGVHVFEITATQIGALTITVTETTTAPTVVTEEPTTEDVVDLPTEDIADPSDLLEEPTELIVPEPIPNDPTIVDEVTDETIDTNHADHSETIEGDTDDLLDELLDEPTDNTADDGVLDDDELLDESTDLIDEPDLTDPTDDAEDWLEEPTDEVTEDIVEEPVDDVIAVPTDEVDDVVEAPVDEITEDIAEEPTDELVVEEPVDDVVEEPVDESTDDVVDEPVETPTDDAAEPSGTITFQVSEAPVATHFIIRSLPSVLADQPAQFVVVALDEANRPVTNYNGTIDLSSTDASATLPDELTFTDANRGVYVFAAEFDTAGPQTLTVNDLSNTDLTGAIAINVLNVPTNFLTIPGFGMGGVRWWW